VGSEALKVGDGRKWSVSFFLSESFSGVRIFEKGSPFFASFPFLFLPWREVEYASLGNARRTGMRRAEFPITPIRVFRSFSHFYWRTRPLNSTRLSLPLEGGQPFVTCTPLQKSPLEDLMTWHPIQSHGRTDEDDCCNLAPFHPSARPELYRHELAR